MSDEIQARLPDQPPAEIQATPPPDCPALPPLPEYDFKKHSSLWNTPWTMGDILIVLGALVCIGLPAVSFLGGAVNKTFSNVSICPQSVWNPPGQDPRAMPTPEQPKRVEPNNDTGPDE